MSDETRDEGVMVRAAGGVVVSHDGRRVLVVHRPRYDDWSLPKGKLDPGETAEDAALREVCEEAGLRCTLGRELDEVRYIDRFGRPKQVRYWVMAAEGGEFVPNDEVDAVRWVDEAEALEVVTYVEDLALIKSALHPSGVEPTK